MDSPQMYLLKLYVENPTLRAYYEEKISEHNVMVFTNPHPDSGFDLAVPAEITIEPLGNILLDLCVKTAMVKIDPEKAEPTMAASASSFAAMPQTPSGFYMYPRSSLGTKTKLRLANSVGIIDSGYRGDLMASLDNIHHEQPHVAEQWDRLVQICAPDLSPFVIQLVENSDELRASTRGEGGFGSTGMN